MTPERAEEIHKAGSQWCNWEKHVTKDEDEYIKEVWSHMPGYTCWHDALCNIKNGRVDEHNMVEFNVGEYFIRGIIINTDGLKYGVRLENGNFVWTTKDSLKWRKIL